MELFSVICTTCHSKLKVRDKAVLGQILACPKCQAMVLVEPPAGWVDTGAAAAPESAPALPAAPVAPSTAPAASNFEDAAALLSQPQAPVAAPPMADVTAPVESPLPLPQTEWLSPQTQAMRRWLLVGGLASIGAIALIGGLVYLFGGGEDPSATAVAAAPPETPPVEASEPIEKEPAARPEAEEPEEPVENQGTDDVQPPDIEPEPEAPQPKPAIEEKPPVADDDTPPDLAAKPDQEEQPAAESAEPKPLDAFSVDKTLKQFGALLEDRPPGADAPAAPLPKPEQSLPSATEPTAPITDDEPLPRPEARNVDVARRLADPLAAIEMHDVPLADFLQFVTDMTALPITLDPTALPAIKTSPETKISVNLKATTVEKLLAEALRPHNLAFVIAADQLTVLPSASTRGELREIKHEVGDLASSEAEAKVLAESIHALIEPASWDDVGGLATMKIEGTTIVVSQTPEAHFAAVVLCEKLRLSRKLPQRSAYPAAALSLTPKAIAAQAVLDTPVTMNFVPPTRIGHVAEHLKRTTGLRLLVDWRALATAGWTPEGEVKVGVANQPVSAFLDRLARRMEVAWRVIDPGTVQLTTSAALAAAPDVEVYPVAADNSAALIDELQQALGHELFVPGGPGALRYDTAGQCLLARLPQPQQRKLIELLAKRGS